MAATGQLAVPPADSSNTPPGNISDADSSEFDPAKYLTADEKSQLAKDAKYEDLSGDEDTINAASNLATSGSFHPSKQLLIGAGGVPAFKLPFPDRQLEIQINDLATNKPAYLSTRTKARKGNAILSSPDGGDLVQSLYKFGPGRGPRLLLLPNETEITVDGRWFNRDTSFSIADNSFGGFRWIYRKELDPNAPRVDDKGKQVKPRPQLFCETNSGKRIAALYRIPERRLVAMHGNYGGKGGELMIDGLALKESGVPEHVLVATCIMMLKKEVDRRRACQFAAMSAMASG